LRIRDRLDALCNKLLLSFVGLLVAVDSFLFLLIARDLIAFALASTLKQIIRNFYAEEIDCGLWS
jgi:hypothetical protein